MEYLAKNNNDGDPGVMIILPSLFLWNPRNITKMQWKSFADMVNLKLIHAIQKYPEITDNLDPSGTPQNRPDLVAHLYKIQLMSLELILRVVVYTIIL